MGELIRNLDEIKLGDETLMVELNEGYSKSQGRVIHIQNKHFRFLMKEKDFVNLAATVLRAKSEMDFYKKTESDNKRKITPVSYNDTDEATKSVISEVAKAFEKGNVRYRKLHEGQSFVSIIVNDSDYGKYKKALKTIKGYKKVEHPYGKAFGYRFLYQMRPFELYVKNNVYVEIFYQLPCMSLTPKTWIPLDRMVQERLWEQERKDDDGIVVPDDQVAYIYRICWAVFKNSSFSDNDKRDLKTILKRTAVLDEEYFIEACKKIFFNYTDDLIGYLKAENYEEIVPAYYVFNKY